MMRPQVMAKGALEKLSKDMNGVDGSSIYIYGEGWDFGEVAKNSRGINASQFNLFQTGIGRYTSYEGGAFLVLLFAGDTKIKHAMFEVESFT